MNAKRWIFLALCLLYAGLMAFLLRQVAMADIPTAERLSFKMRYLVGGSLLASYGFFVLQQFLTGRTAIEYVVVMPVITLMAAFLCGAVLGIAGVQLYGDPFLQAGILYAIFMILVAARLWRRFWWPARRKTDASVY
ncbi:hypothetical protein EPD60_11625 [Flaviaesturariibacter flavus]|uniref:Uncharacterized protein n=1 Tax=Flaviaesturariibacter flavus TaxID=2502780 RepID=A0A4R1B9X9_9BACT|nr:hypothetical protein [Flaviaesturariibacter flavus]TCJ13740.1 hypothetical protein EPD60_11625 [Flaviaesturariibacter flavus]